MEAEATPLTQGLAQEADPDVLLVERLRREDPDAVEQLLREHGPPLLALARSLTGCDQQARDVLQETMIKAIHSIATLERPGALRAWLHRIAANAALQHLRARTRRRERPIEKLLPTFSNDGHREGVSPTWARQEPCRMEQEETRCAVRAAIEQLPDAYREIIMLRDLIGFDTAEAAEALGVTPNLAKVRLHRARQALRSLLEEEFGS